MLGSMRPKPGHWSYVGFLDLFMVAALYRKAQTLKDQDEADQFLDPANAKDARLPGKQFRLYPGRLLKPPVKVQGQESTKTTGSSRCNFFGTNSPVDFAGVEGTLTSRQLVWPMCR